MSEAGNSFGEVLVRLAGERPGLLVVAGNDASLVTWFADIWPERVVTVPPSGSRMRVAQGIALGGGDAVVVLDQTTEVLPAGIDAPMLLLTDDPAHLTMAHRAGITVCQAGWAQDLPALLVGALGSDGPTLLHVTDPLPGLPKMPDPGRTTFGEPRVLHRGQQGLLVGAGRTAPVAALVAQQLARGQLDVTAVDSHTLGPDSGIDARVTLDHLLVGPLSAPRAGALQQVPVDPDDLRVTVMAARRVLET